MSTSDQTGYSVLNALIRDHMTRRTARAEKKLYDKPIPEQPTSPHLPRPKPGYEYKSFKTCGDDSWYRESGRASAVRERNVAVMEGKVEGRPRMNLTTSEAPPPFYTRRIEEAGASIFLKSDREATTALSSNTKCKESPKDESNTGGKIRIPKTAMFLLRMGFGRKGKEPKGEK